MAIKISGTEVIDNSRSIVNAIDGTFSGGVSALYFSGSGIVPAGLIAMWYGNIASIPTGWLLCDGTNNTPDLRNRFIVGAHSGTGNGLIPTTGPVFGVITGNLIRDYTPGDTGGSTAHQLTEAQMPAHNHTLSRYSGNSNVNSQSSRYALATTNDIGPDSTTATGGNRYHENRPPYYALAFIMKSSVDVFSPA